MRIIILLLCFTSISFSQNDTITNKQISIYEVDEAPKFVVEGTEFPLVVNKDLHKDYKKIVVREFQKSSVLKKLEGLVILTIHINKDGFFDGKLLKYPKQEDEKKNNLIEMEILRIFQHAFKYIPAKHKNMNVEIRENYGLKITI